MNNLHLVNVTINGNEYQFLVHDLITGMSIDRATMLIRKRIVMHLDPDGVTKPVVHVTVKHMLPTTLKAMCGLLADDSASKRC